MKTMPIEAFLTWVFLHELPKAGPATAVAPGNWAMNGLAELWTVIDRDMPDVSLTWYDQGPPAADAIVAGDAVRALAGQSVDIADDWNPFPGWPDPHGLIAADVGRAIERHRQKPVRSRDDHIVRLVTTAAILGRGPDWRSTLPKTRQVTRGGKPAWFVQRQIRDRFGRLHAVETDGFNKRSQRPRRGAYRKFELKRSLVGDALSRLDWQLWVDALGTVHESLRGKLQNHRIASPEMHRNPWIMAPVKPVQPVENNEGDGEWPVKKAFF